MRLRVDKENDALYFRLDESKIVESEEVRPGVILDFDGEGRVVGVEFLGITSRASNDELTSLQFQSAETDGITRTAPLSGFLLF
jgi:uncharacterized protein YuzE